MVAVVSPLGPTTVRFTVMDVPLCSITSVRLCGPDIGPKLLLSRAMTQVPLRLGVFCAARGAHASRVRPREPARRANLDMRTALSEGRGHHDIGAKLASWADGA